MINQEELAQILQAGDGTTLELSNFINPEVEKTISAFANTLGGYIFFGFKDDGKAVGLTVRQEEDYTKRLISLCQVMNVEFELYPSNYDMKVILVLRIYKNKYKYRVRTVNRGDSPPVRLLLTLGRFPVRGLRTGSLLTADWGLSLGLTGL